MEKGLPLSAATIKFRDEGEAAERRGGGRSQTFNRARRFWAAGLTTLQWPQAAAKSVHNGVQLLTPGIRPAVLSKENQPSERKTAKIPYTTGSLTNKTVSRKSEAPKN